MLTEVIKDASLLDRKRSAAWCPVAAENPTPIRPEMSRSSIFILKKKGQFRWKTDGLLPFAVHFLGGGFGAYRAAGDN